MKLKLYSLVLLTALSVAAQTQIDLTQVRSVFITSHPATETFFSTEWQTSFILAPGTNKEIVKVVVFRNGLRQSDFPRISPPERMQDYVLSSDKKTITFTFKLPVEQTIIVDYWTK